jgi:hypothetical protein
VVEVVEVVEAVVPSVASVASVAFMNCGQWFEGWRWRVVEQPKGARLERPSAVFRTEQSRAGAGLRLFTA